jgi:sigma-B regulation protein RsbU (phosphoserine phosphatase)
LEILADVNAGIHSLGNRSVFVTMLFGVFDPAARTFQFVRAGHTPLLWRKSGGEVVTLSPRGIGIGMTGPRSFSTLCEPRTITTAPGDFLILYSDGVNEAMNENTEEFGDERLLATVRDRITNATTAEEARVILVQAVDDFRGTAAAHDDMTLVVLKSEGEEGRREIARAAPTHEWTRSAPVRVKSRSSPTIPSSAVPARRFGERDRT